MIALVAPRHRQEAKLDGSTPLLPLLEEEIHGLFGKGYSSLVLPLAERRKASVAQRVRCS